MSSTHRVKKIINSFFEGIFNFFLFFPYFFSVPVLFTTFFKPWKNLVGKKTGVGFSVEEWFNKLSFNVISRLMGFTMRFSILIFFLILETVYIILLPFIILIFFTLLPFIYLATRFVKSQEEQKELHKKRFLNEHSITPATEQAVNEWFDSYYEKVQQQKKWWTFNNLFSIPPLARDWAYGYTPVLDQYVEDLTNVGVQSKIQNAVGREDEISSIEQALIKNVEGNIVLVGEEGVGKHAILDALSKRIYEGRSNNLLAYKRILKLNAEKILSEQTDQKQREIFLEELLREASEASNIILTIENLDRYVITTKDRVDISVPLEKFAKTSKLHIIGTSTPNLYQKFIFPNEQIARIFTKINIKEISKTDAVQVLLNLVLDIEMKNKVLIPYETVINAVEKSDYYITDVPFPEKAIDLLDSACIYAVQKEKKETRSDRVIVSPDDIDAVISQETQVPTKLNDDLKKKLLNIKINLSSVILHQPEAVDAIEKTIQSSFVLLGKRKKPLASFLFLGPTGVGKTETAKALASLFFGDEKHLIRLDMSSYQQKSDIPQLIGSMEKQVPGLMTEQVRELPYGVLLLDEIEKAHKDLINIFLTLLDEGYFIDGYGKRVDCRHLMVVATSNAASNELFKSRITHSQLMDFLIEGRHFSPEFLNRFDGVIAYQTLNQDALFDLGRKILKDNTDKLYKLHKIQVNVRDQTLRNLISKAYKPEFGARNLQREINAELESKVARLILEGKIKEGAVVTI